MVNIANVVTVGRALVTLVALNLICQGDDARLWMAFVLTILIIWADGLDGYLARKLNQTSKIGGILDIASDRVVEMSYWIVFACLGWVPVWVPLLFLFRGIFVDSFRTALGEKGYTAFGANTMMQSAIGKFLVSSNFSRFSYAVLKAFAFCFLIAAKTRLGILYNLECFASLAVYGACVFCVLRGLPVLLEAPALLKDN